MKMCTLLLWIGKNPIFFNQKLMMMGHGLTYTECIKVSSLLTFGMPQSLTNY